MPAANILLNDRLRALRADFNAEGFEVWFVGGCVRDTLLGLDPKDIDLCTDANPDEQIAVYSKHNYSFHTTGLQHGTITVVMNHEPYEITSLRTDLACDGRHAEVAYTRDLKTDLERRDLTFNAMALDFDGNLIDPFNGREDLQNRRTRMVGDAGQRFLEDYLRILRFFRFHARIAGAAPLDKDAVAAIKQHKEGLRAISAERIWMEVSKIISGPFGAETLAKLFELDIAPIIGLPAGDFDAVRAAKPRVSDPAALMGLFLNKGEIQPLANRWKWSRKERLMANFIADHKNMAPNVATIKALVIDGWEREDIKVWLDLFNYDPRILVQWDTPRFPVSGNELMDRGFKGTAIGAKMKELKAAWADSDYLATREELLALI